MTALRAVGNDIPICVLSARDTVNDRIAGLEAGADDYPTKPFDLGELAARLNARCAGRHSNGGSGRVDDRAPHGRHGASTRVRERRNASS